MNRLTQMILLVILLSLVGCRTMELNQDGQVLEKGTSESTI